MDSAMPEPDGPAAAPWLSILIPVYNVAPYLRACIDSIVPQLPADGVEVLLLDDASTDGSLRICEEICAERGAAFRLIRHEANGGVSAARNSLLDAAGGDYIWFVDSDDEVAPGSLARIADVVERHAPDLLLCAQSFYYAPESWIYYRVREGSIMTITSRTRGRFDDRKNDDIAVALTGFADAARRAMPDMSADSAYAITQFWAKEFTKICWRLLSTRFGRDPWRDISVKARRYRVLMDARALMPFADLNRAHLRRGKPGRWVVLGLCLLWTRGASTEASV